MIKLETLQRWEEKEREQKCQEQERQKINDKLLKDIRDILKEIAYALQDISNNI